MDLIHRPFGCRFGSGLTTEVAGNATSDPAQDSAHGSARTRCNC